LARWDLADEVHGAVGVCLSTGEEAGCRYCGRRERSWWVGVVVYGSTGEGVGCVCVGGRVCASGLGWLLRDIGLHWWLLCNDGEDRKAWLDGRSLNEEVNQLLLREGGEVGAFLGGGRG